MSNTKDSNNKKAIFSPVISFIKKKPWIFAIIALAIIAVFVVISLIPPAAQPLLVDYYIDQLSAYDILNDPLKPLRIRFYGSVAPIEMVDKAIESGITVNPSIEGSWAWEGDSVLVFSPSEKWPIGQSYNGQINPQVLAEHVKIEWNFVFSLPELKLKLSSHEFYIDPENEKIKRITAVLESNYPLDPSSLDNKIILKPDIKANNGRFEKRDYSSSISYSDDYLKAFIVSEPLGMPASDITMVLAIQKGIASRLGGTAFGNQLTAMINVPGSSTYVKVNSISHQLVRTPDQKYDQVITINTKGEVLQKELIDNLEAYVLPVNRPALPGLEESLDHRWGNLEEITTEVLSHSQKLALKAIPNERDYFSINSFKINVAPRRYIYIKLKEGTRFYGDYYLAYPSEEIIQIKDYPKELEILSDGAVLSLSGDKKLTIMTRGIDGINISLGRVIPEDINHLVSQSNRLLTNLRFNNYHFNQNNLTESYSETRSVPNSDPREAQFVSFDFTKYLVTIPDKKLRYGLFFIEVRGQNSYSNYSDKRFVMVTDLGFFVKSNTNGSKDIFIQSISNGQPISDAEVQLIGINGNPLFSGYSSFDGQLQFPSVSGFDKEKTPIAYIVKKGNDLSFMPYNAGDRRLDYSGFDIGGVRGVTDPGKINAYLFSDRGIYRPGDEMRIGMIVKAGDWSINLANTPLECRVIDSKGAEVFTQAFNLSSSGLEEIKYSTMAYSPTGEYKVSLYLIKKESRSEERVFLGSTTTKVEEFLPDNLKISSGFLPLSDQGWIKPDQLKAQVMVKNLFGTPAAGNKVNGQITLTPGYKRFNAFKDYSFFDPLLGKQSYEEFLGEGKTDDKGICEYDIDLSKFEKASYNLQFYAEAFEKGSGRSVSTESSILVSPLEYLIGYKADGTLSYIKKNSARKVSFLALNPALRRVLVPDLVLKINEKKFISTLVQQPNGLYKYQSVPRSYEYKSEKFSIAEKGRTFDLPTTLAGNFEVLIMDKEELVLSRFDYSVVSDENIQRSLERSAELEIRLNKNDFKTNESIEVFIQAPYKGSGLITIERDKVYTHKWFSTDGSATVQRISVPSGLEGNGYVTIAFVRAQDSPEIYMSPLCYGSVPFSVSKDSSTNPIRIKLPDEAKPGKPFPIEYKTDYPGKIIVFAIDEGILQVGNYDTPDPLAFYFKKRALEVTTEQILDLILPEFSVAQSLAAIGGGLDAEMLARNLNPFKRRDQVPVAFWSGILETGPETRTVYYDIPGYFNGDLRVMAVAVSPDRIGAAEEHALIRDTFIIKPNNPMSAAPGDEFEVSVNITNNQKGSGKASVIAFEAVPSEHLTIVSGAKQSLKIDEAMEENIVLKIKVNDRLGPAEIKFTASAKGDSSSYSAYMSIRPAVVYQSRIFTGAAKKGSETIVLPGHYREELNTHEVALSYLPLGMANGLNFFLSHYPYGCTEQLVSSAFPHLFINIMKNQESEPVQSKLHVSKIISILQARQKPDGSFGLWTERSQDHPLINLYVLHFLTEAMSKAYYVPTSMLSKAIGMAQSLASSNMSSWSSVMARANAIYLLTLNEFVTTSYIESLLGDLRKNHKGWENSFVGLYLAGSYAMLQQSSKAESLIKSVGRQFKDDESYFYLDELSFSALYLYMMAKHFPKDLKKLSSELLENISTQLSRNHYTTFSANYSLMGIEAYMTQVPDPSDKTFSVYEVFTKDDQRLLNLTGDRLVKALFNRDTQSMKIDNQAEVNLFYQITKAGYLSKIPEKAEHHGMECSRVFFSQDGKEITSCKLGDTVKVTLRFRSTDSPHIYQAALVDLIPAGLEIDITSVREAEKSGKWRSDYIDIREDRLVLFGTLAKDLMEFTYLAKAINKGSFVVPPLYGEAMYDQSLWTMGGKKILIIE
ncbi:MAG: alpha-2-macroglobulin [Spirochaetales bacterium]|nr:alpha-2-macroglobulin [Spirochaetales bacterium]